jgi:hypothetical protein
MITKTVKESSKFQYDGSYNFLEIAHKTAKADRKSYYSKSRPGSLQRLQRTIWPNLKQPIFLIGSPRSGTTFLGDCLGKIPEISYHFEPVATKVAANFVYTNQWNFNQAKAYYYRVYRWLMRLHLDGDLRFAEKTPRNCFIIDFLSQAFPEAQFIHIIRDGRDTALSHSKKPWMQAASAESHKFEPGGFPIGPYARFWVEPDRVNEFESTSDIHRCIWAWKRHTESAIQSLNKLSKSMVHELRYESLVANPAEDSERLLNFLGIADKTSRNYFRKAVSTANSHSVGQWRKELAEQQLHFIESEAGSLLAKLGY